MAEIRKHNYWLVFFWCPATGDTKPVRIYEDPVEAFRSAVNWWNDKAPANYITDVRLMDINSTYDRSLLFPQKNGFRMVEIKRHHAGNNRPENPNHIKFHDTRPWREYESESDTMSAYDARIRMK